LRIADILERLKPRDLQDGVSVELAAALVVLRQALGLPNA
jgi:hypothetical protein